MFKNTSRFLIFLFCMLCIPGFAQAQAKKPGVVHMPTKTIDTGTVNRSFRLAFSFSRKGRFDEALKLSKSTLALAKSINYQSKLAKIYNIQAYIYTRTGKYQEAINCANTGLLLAQQLNDSVDMSSAYNNLGTSYAYMADHVKALTFYFKALNIEEKIKIQTNLHWLYSNIGNLYNVQKNYSKALEFSYRAVAVEQRIKDYRALSLTLSNMGNIYSQLDKNDSSLLFYNRSLKAAHTSQDTFSIANSLANIALLYTQLKQYNKAKEYSLKSYKMSKSQGLMDVSIFNLSNLATINQKLKNYDKAEKYFMESIRVSKQIANKELLLEMYRDLSFLYAEKNEFEKAYALYKSYSLTKDTVLNQGNIKLITEMNTKYTSEKKEKEIELLKKNEDIQKLELVKKKNELDKQRTVSFSVFGGFILIMIVAGLLFNRYRLKKKANDQLQDAFYVIEEKNKVIEKSNVLITDSITYAKRIQDAILPAKEDISKAISDDFFVLYQPAQIVSGDFYWCSTHNRRTIFVVADCTGHGVPGAFMSMIGNTLLNEIVNERQITDTKEIAHLLDQKIIHALHQHTDSDQYDGMDISICCMDKDAHEITFTGAHHAMYACNGSFKKIKGDSYAIGGAQQQNSKLFTTQTIAYEKGLQLYFLTDGYCDQSGGTSNKRFSSRQFENLLEDIKQLKMEEQKEKLKTAFANWKGETKQRDDVLVVGIKC